MMRTKKWLDEAGCVQFLLRKGSAGTQAIVVLALSHAFPAAAIPVSPIQKEE
jgi:hypothetical protein